MQRRPRNYGRGPVDTQPPGGPRISVPVSIPFQNAPALPGQDSRFGLFGRVNNFLKDKKIISKGLRAVGANKLADFAHTKGYGKKKRARRKRKVGGCRCR